MLNVAMLAKSILLSVKPITRNKKTEENHRFDYAYLVFVIYAMEILYDEKTN